MAAGRRLLGCLVYQRVYVDSQTFKAKGCVDRGRAVLARSKEVSKGIYYAINGLVNDHIHPIDHMQPCGPWRRTIAPSPLEGFRKSSLLESRWKSHSMRTITPVNETSILTSDDWLQFIAMLSNVVLARSGVVERGTLPANAEHRPPLGTTSSGQAGLVALSSPKHCMNDLIFERSTWACGKCIDRQHRVPGIRARQCRRRHLASGQTTRRRHELRLADQWRSRGKREEKVFPSSESTTP